MGCMTQYPVIKDDYSEWGKKYVQWLINSRITMTKLCEATWSRNSVYTALRRPEKSLLIKDRMELFRHYVEQGKDLRKLREEIATKEAMKNTYLTQIIKKRISKLGLDYTKIGKSLDLRPELVSRLVNGQYLNGDNIKRLLKFLSIKPSLKAIRNSGPYFNSIEERRVAKVRQWVEKNSLNTLDLSYGAYGNDSNRAPIYQVLKYSRRSLTTLAKLERLMNLGIAKARRKIEDGRNESYVHHVNEFIAWKKEVSLTNTDIAHFLPLKSKDKVIKKLDNLEILGMWKHLKKLMRSSFVAPEDNLKLTEEDLHDHDCITAIIWNGYDDIIVMNHTKLKRWMPPVGKVKSGESIEDGLKRELYEELGIEPYHYTEIGNKQFILNRNKQNVKIRFHVFIIHDYKGSITNMEPNKCSEIKTVSRQWIYDHMLTSHAMHLVARALSPNLKRRYWDNE